MSTRTRMIWKGRVPESLPEWLRTRIEVNVREIRALMEFASQRLRSKDRVLDAGAGEGRFKSYFAHTRYTAVDFALGDQTWNYSNLDVVASLENLPFANGVYDAAICTQVLEHVQDPLQVITELARVLKPGGQLFLSAPQNWHQHQKPHDYFRFTSFGLAHLFNQSNLEPQFIKPMGGYFWFLSFQLQMFHFWLWPPSQEEGPVARIARLAVTVLVRILFLFILPLPLYYLDRLDKRKDQTLGYTCHCIKPGP